MNRDDGPAPGAQRSVAELLAAYGAESRRDGPARSDPDARRRRAALATDTPPQATRPSSSAPRSTGPGPADPSPSADPDTAGGVDYGPSSGAPSPPAPAARRSFDQGAPAYGSPPFGDGPSRGPTYGGPTYGGPSSYSPSSYSPSSYGPSSYDPASYSPSSYGPAPGDSEPNGNAVSSASAGPVSYARDPFPPRDLSWVPDGAWAEQGRPGAPDPRERPAAESYRTPDDDETGALPISGPTGEPARAQAARGTATLRRADPPAGLQRTDVDHTDGGHTDVDHTDVDDAQAYGTDGAYGVDRDGYADHDGYEDRDGYEDGYEDEYDGDLEDDDAAARPGAREWAAVVVQVVLGAILGAVLWVGFSYLWKYLPPVALVLALVSTTGLVFGVRAMRRSDDLKTTVLAVVVGLLVTVSPAVLVLLVGSQG